MVCDMKKMWILIGAQMAALFIAIVLAVLVKSFFGVMVMFFIMILLLLLFALELKRQQGIQNFILSREREKNTR